MKPCKHCGELFTPRGRQLYCKPEHKRAYEVRAKRQWRTLVGGVRKWVTVEDARESRAPRKSRYLQLADVVDDFESGLWLIFPDERYEKRRHKYEPEDVSDWPAISAPRVWMLDGRRLKAQDRIAHGFPPEYEVLTSNALANEDRTPEAGQHIQHVRNGVYSHDCRLCRSLPMLSIDDVVMERELSLLAYWYRLETPAKLLHMFARRAIDELVDSVPVIEELLTELP